MAKMLISIDFDGVVHDYLKGWQDGSIYGQVVPGFFEWASEAQDHFRLAVFSSRSKTPEGIAAMREWLAAQWAAYQGAGAVTGDEMLGWSTFPMEKPPAFMTIDDRACRFDGKWDAAALSPDAIKRFKPWNVVAA